MPIVEDDFPENRVMSQDEQLLEMFYLAADIDHLSRLAMRMRCPEIAQALAQTASDILALARISREKGLTLGRPAEELQRPPLKR